MIETLSTETLSKIMLGFFKLIDEEVSIFRETKEAESFLNFLAQLGGGGLLVLTREETQRHLRENLSAESDYFNQLTNLWVKMKTLYLGEEVMAQLVNRIVWSLDLIGPNPDVSQTPVPWRTHGLISTINDSVNWSAVPAIEKLNFWERLLVSCGFLTIEKPTHRATAEEFIRSNEHIVLLFLLSLANAYVRNKELP
jgi:hypothetical protein